MPSRKTGAIVAVVGVIAAVVLFVVLSGDDGSDSENATTGEASATATTTGGGSGQAGSEAGRQGGGGSEDGAAPKVPTIVVEGGQPVGGVQELTFTKGDEIRFTVRSDVADEVHLHGYDVMKEVPAGGRITFDVPATIDGVFEVELEQRVVPLGEITVEP